MAQQRPLNRRTFLRGNAIRGAAVLLAAKLGQSWSGPALRAQQVPTSTTIGAATLYSGPGNTGYTTIAQIPAGVPLSVTGVFGDFAQVTVAAQDAAAAGLASDAGLAGFLVSTAIDVTPDGTPTLDVSDVPWVALFRQAVAAAFQFHNAKDSYDGSWLDGTAFDNLADTRIDLGIAIDANAAPAATAVTGLWISNSQNSTDADRTVRILYDRGVWVISYHVGQQSAGGNVLTFVAPPSTQFTIHIPADGTACTVTNASDPSSAAISAPLTPPLFSEGNVVRLQTQLGAQCSLALSDVAISQAPTGRFDASISPSLAALGRQRNLIVGAVTDLRSDALALKQERVLTQDCALWYPASAFQWIIFEPIQGQFDFAQADAAVSLVATHSMDLYIEPLVWAATDPITVVSGMATQQIQTAPTWLANGAFSASQLTNIMHDHIYAIADRYREVFTSTTVAITGVLEGVTLSGSTAGYADGVWHRVLGDDYVRQVYQLAFQAFPHATLLYEDFDIMASGPKTDFVYGIIQNLLRSGLHVGVGMESFIDAASPPRWSDVHATIQRFTALGVPVWMGGANVDVRNVPGSTDDKLRIQAQVYQQLTDVCLQAGAAALYFYGLGDGDQTWPPGAQLPSVYDSQYNPKPARTAITARLTSSG